MSNTAINGMVNIVLSFCLIVFGVAGTLYVKKTNQCAADMQKQIKELEDKSVKADFLIMNTASSVDAMFAVRISRIESELDLPTTLPPNKLPALPNLPPKEILLQPAPPAIEI